MKTFYFALLGVLTCLVAPAQSHKFTVTLNPFSFVERDGGFTPGIGYNLNNRIAIYTDLGLIFFSAGRYTGSLVNTDKAFGYKVKPAIRFYLHNNEMPHGSFFEMEGLYKHVAYNATDEIDVIDNNGNFAFTYLGGYTIKKDVYGFAVKYGHRSFLDKEKRLGMDFYFGIGGRTKDFAIRDLPAAVPMDNDPFAETGAFTFFWRRGSTAYFPAGLKLFFTF